MVMGQKDAPPGVRCSEVECTKFSGWALCPSLLLLCPLPPAPDRSVFSMEKTYQHCLNVGRSLGGVFSTAVVENVLCSMFLDGAA